MMILFRWLFNAVFIMLATYFLNGIEVESFYAALVTALFLGVVNAVIRPIITILTLPINILTLGLFSLVINGLMVMLVATFVKGFSVNGFLPALSLSLFLWLGSMISSMLLKKDE